MSEFDELLARLDEKGLWLELLPEEKIQLRGPKGEHTPDLRRQLVAHKPALLRWLKRGNAVAVPDPKPHPVTADLEATCLRCQATVCFPAANGGLFCDRRDCPHQKLWSIPQATSGHVWRWSLTPDAGSKTTPAASGTG